MDDIRLVALHQVYNQLSQQSTGPDGTQEDAAPAVPTSAVSSTSPVSLQATAGPAFAPVDTAMANNSAGLSQGFNLNEPLMGPTAAQAGSGGISAPLSGAATTPPLLSSATSFMSDSEHTDGGGAAGGAGSGAGPGPAAAAAAAGSKRKRKRSERNSFYPASYFEWTDELMANELPERSRSSFVAAVFELGLKHSSPKVLMKLMPPKAVALTTEHIKSRLQKYRLHAQRSKEEFLEFFNLRLQSKFADFLQKEGWRKLSPEHGRQGHHDESGYDSSAGGGADGGGGARGSVSARVVKVDGQMVGDIRDLGAQCVREQFHLQEVLRQHISAQLKLQAEIHEHLTTAGASTAAPSSAATPTPTTNPSGGLSPAG